MHLQARLDLGFVWVEGAAAMNDVPGGTVHPEFVALPRGTALQYRGARNGLVECIYQGPFTSQFQASFGSAGVAALDMSCMGVVSFVRPYDPDSFPGDSGAALWGTFGSGVLGFTGQLIGVSLRDPLGLIVRLADASQKAGLTSYRVLRGAS